MILLDQVIRVIESVIQQEKEECSKIVVFIFEKVKSIWKNITTTSHNKRIVNDQIIISTTRGSVNTTESIIEIQSNSTSSVVLNNKEENKYMSSLKLYTVECSNNSSDNNTLLVYVVASSEETAIKTTLNKMRERDDNYNSYAKCTKLIAAEYELYFGVKELILDLSL